ncbi:MAG: SPOR domain-containing protein [Fimbriimonadales bacterium]|nr:SPOR domain-containing protein [Fimbriimonadales bacterium]
MPLDFQTVDEDEGFSMKRFLRTVSLGVAVFLLFLALGYYVIGPRLTFTPEGIPQLRWRTGGSGSASTPAHQPPPPPKVEVYEKLPAEVVAATGAEIGTREVAPFDYEQYLKRRARTRSQKQVQPESPAEESMPSDEEEPLVVPDEPETLPSEVPADAPAPPVVEEPAPIPPPLPPTQPEQPDKEPPLYRVQVGVYDVRENANSVVQALIGRGFQASIVPFQVEGRTRYRVQVLVTRDRLKAEQMKQQLESSGFTAYIAEVR